MGTDVVLDRLERVTRDLTNLTESALNLAGVEDAHNAARAESSSPTPSPPIPRSSPSLRPFPPSATSDLQRSIDQLRAASARIDLVLGDNPTASTPRTALGQLDWSQVGVSRPPRSSRDERRSADSSTTSLSSLVASRERSRRRLLALSSELDRDDWIITPPLLPTTSDSPPPPRETPEVISLRLPASLERRVNINRELLPSSAFRSGIPGLAVSLDEGRNGSGDQATRDRMDEAWVQHTATMLEGRDIDPASRGQRRMGERRMTPVPVGRLDRNGDEVVERRPWREKEGSATNGGPEGIVGR